MRSSTKTIASAMRILSVDVQTDDGVANAALMEAADRLDELQLIMDDLKGLDIEQAMQSGGFKLPHKLRSRIQLASATNETDAIIKAPDNQDSVTL